MSYLCLQDWMKDNLHLTGVKLIIYGIIYGFSQDGKSDFHGSLSYLQSWTGSCENTVRKYLIELVKEELITAYATQGGTTHYKAKIEPPQNLSLTPAKIEGDNKDNNKEDIVSKDTTPKKKNLYEQCVDVVQEIISDNDVQERLIAYLSVRIKDKTLSAKSWETIVNKLYELADTKELALQIIQQSIDKCYRSFYPLSCGYQKKDSGGARQTGELVEDKIGQAYHEWAEDARFFGTPQEFRELVEKGEIVL